MSGSGSGGVYTGTVTATVTDADNAGGSGVASVSYVLDGGPDACRTPCRSTSPRPARTPSDRGRHGRPGQQRQRVDQLDDPVSTDTTAPTASIGLAGTLTSPGNYTGPVTATVTSADEAGGSGLASTTYTLDGGAVLGVHLTGDRSPRAGHHTLAVTVKDNAGNTGTASSSWTQTAASALGARR